MTLNPVCQASKTAWGEYNTWCPIARQLWGLLCLLEILLLCNKPASKQLRNTQDLEPPTEFIHLGIPQLRQGAEFSGNSPIGHQYPRKVTGVTGSLLSCRGVVDI